MLEQTLHDQTETTLDNPGRRLPLPTAEMTSTPTLTLTPTAEMMALSYASTHKPLAMVSLVAPALTVDRLPVDVVAMVDCSGSMHGDKMEQMKNDTFGHATKAVNELGMQEEQWSQLKDMDICAA